MITWLHGLRHRLGWNRGTVVAATDRHGTVWVGFRCVECGKVSGIHASWADAPAQDKFT